MAQQSLIDLAQLTALLRAEPGSLDDDVYTLFMVDAADDLVRSTAGHPEWVRGPLDEDSGETDVVAPPRACIIATLLAKRGVEDSGNLQRKTAGPISETYFEGGITGLMLTPEEIEYLEGQNPDSSNGLWVQHIGGTVGPQPVYLLDGAPGADTVLVDDGSSGWVYGE